MRKQPVFEIPATIKEDTAEYEEIVDKFLADNLDAARFRGHRVPMGVYSQRSETGEIEKYMVRVRAPGGVITEQQLATLNQLADEYGQGYLHFTTRQDVQIHYVDIEDTPEILYRLLEVGLSPRGGGGNTVRNIMNSPRAGVHPEEVFDTTPHALALTKYLIKARSSFNLPRKYKIAFSSTSNDEALATVNDLGFIAKKQEGERGFKVYAAGGMGNSPEVALLLDDFIPEEKIFHVAEAIKRFFDDYGDRSNKHKARIRFIRKRLGEEEFVAKYKEYLEEVEADDLDVEPINYYEEPRESLASEDHDLSPDFIHSEQATGYYSLELRPPEGDVTYQEVKELLAALPDGEISLRTTNKQGLLIRGIRVDQVDKLKEAINEINEEFLVANKSVRPIACKGASTCRLGLCLSPNLAAELRSRLGDLAPEVQNNLPQLYISGCPNCCGQHIIGKIGLEGKAKRFNDQLVPHYSVYLGGNVAEGETRYGESAIDIPAKRLPDFLVDLAQKLAEDSNYTGDFNAYLAEVGTEQIVAWAKEYTTVPNYEENPDLYKDWGQEEDFSLAGRGPGECGAGVMDIIRLDIDTAKDNYQAAKEEETADKLYQAVVDAARALLVVRGSEPEKDRVILSEFEEEFIETGLVDKSQQEVLEAAFDYKLGDLEDFFAYSAQIEDLINRVEYLFNSLNSDLEFDVETNSNESTTEKEVEVNDLRGVECPLNFVKAKAAIAPLESGQILELYLDPGEPIENVPQSLASEGHEILSEEQTEDGHYILRVRKA